MTTTDRPEYHALLELGLDDMHANAVLRAQPNTPMALISLWQRWLASEASRDLEYPQGFIWNQLVEGAKPPVVPVRYLDHENWHALLNLGLSQRQARAVIDAQPNYEQNYLESEWPRWLRSSSARRINNRAAWMYMQLIQGKNPPSFLDDGDLDETS